MVDNDIGYFYILHQVEFDLEVDHEFLMRATKKDLDRLLEFWFEERFRKTDIKHSPSESLKEGVYNWKEQERELEEE